MPIRIGASGREPSRIYVGDRRIDRVYRGGTLIWGAAPAQLRHIAVGRLVRTAARTFSWQLHWDNAVGAAAPSRWRIRRRIGTTATWTETTHTASPASFTTAFADMTTAQTQVIQVRAEHDGPPSTTGPWSAEAKLHCTGVSQPQVRSRGWAENPFDPENPNQQPAHGLPRPVITDAVEARANISPGDFLPDDYALLRLPAGQPADSRYELMFRSARDGTLFQRTPFGWDLLTADAPPGDTQRFPSGDDGWTYTDWYRTLTHLGVVYVPYFYRFPTATERAVWYQFAIRWATPAATGVNKGPWSNIVSWPYRGAVGTMIPTRWY